MARWFRYGLVIILIFSLNRMEYAVAANSFGSGITICAEAPAPAPLVNPTVVSGAQCTRAGIQAALDNGGQIQLACGSTPVPIDQVLKFNPQKDTVLDGGGVVTLDGQGKTSILFKDWQDPVKYPSVTITLQNIRIINGSAPTSGETSGGALVAGHPGTRVHILNSTFENNRTTDIHSPDNQGGAIFVHNSYETVISGSVFRNNQAGNGGAIGGIATGMLIYNSLFSANQAVDATNGDIVRGYGGALALDGVFNDYNPNSNRTLYVCGSRFENNTAVRGGGAVDAVVSDGFGTKATFLKSMFVSNSVTGFPDPAHPGDYLFGQGGAIYHVEDDRVGGANEDNFEVRDSTFSSNQARKQGGALWVSILGKGRVVNSTFATNSTSAPLNTVGQGGAAFLSGTFDVTNTTFASNHAAYQGGALFAGGPDNAVTLTNTIFYNNTLNIQTLPSETKWQGYHTNRSMLDGGQNIQYPRMKPDFGNDVNNLITAAPIFADPKLSGLADNGGPTLTMALLPGSPAQNAALTTACPPRDQRGYLRQAACDIGPFELGGAPFIPTIWVYLPIIY